jgi:hypothetical protein
MLIGIWLSLVQLGDIAIPKIDTRVLFLPTPVVVREISHELPSRLGLLELKLSGQVLLTKLVSLRHLLLALIHLYLYFNSARPPVFI